MPHIFNSVTKLIKINFYQHNNGLELIRKKGKRKRISIPLRTLAERGLLFLSKNANLKETHNKCRNK